jgi:hypothetical protein
MALLGDFSNGYTKTGGNWFSRMSGYLSYVPIPIPFFGGFIRAGLVYTTGMIGTGLDSLGWLVRGKVGSAATAAVAGTVSTTVNSAASVPLLLNWGSGIATGRTIGTHARKLTESAIGTVGGAVGFKPQVLRSYTAGIGSIGGGMVQQGPGRFVTQVAQSRGEDPNAAYARLNSNQSDHLSALQAAQSQGGYRGM